MDFEEKIKKQITEMQSFLDRQKDLIKDYEKDLAENIGMIQDTETKMKLNSLLNEAKKGNLENVQKIIKSLTKDVKEK